VPEAVSGGARLPALEVSGGAALIDGQPATSVPFLRLLLLASHSAAPQDALFDHVINHLDRLDGVLDERAAELEARRFVQLPRSAAVHLTRAQSAAGGAGG